MGILAILFSGAEPFEQVVSTLSIEDRMWNLMKIVQAVSEEKFQNYTILYMYIAQGQWQITHRGQKFDCNLQVLLLESS